MNAQRYLVKAQGTLARSYETLASGMRINHASDDAAGLAVASGLNTDVRIYSQAVRNVNDAFSYLAVGQAAIRELKNITTRATQSANGVFSSLQREALNDEADALTQE